MFDVIDLNLKSLSNQEDKWFNLETGRFSKNKKYEHTHIIQMQDSQKLQICGNEESIKYFKKLNNPKLKKRNNTLDKFLLDNLNPDDFDIFSFRDFECLGKVINVVDGDWYRGSG